MSRLWDKGTPLDDRVLAFTAGEDHALDERLVGYDVLASIAHARMLAGRGLITQDDFKVIEKGLIEVGDEHAKGTWKITLSTVTRVSATSSRFPICRSYSFGSIVHFCASKSSESLTDPASCCTVINYKPGSLNVPQIAEEPAA